MLFDLALLVLYMVTHLCTLQILSDLQAFLAIFTVLVTIFAARKFTQPVKDDIGDKSVFIFQALPEEQQEAQLAAIRQSKGADF